MCIFTLDFFICKVCRVFKICLQVLSYNSLYALSLHQPCSFFGFPVLHMLGGIRGLVHIKVITNTYSILRYNLFTSLRNVHGSLLI